MKNPGTPGGKRLRVLREYAGKTQLEVELDADLGIGYLQRLESGKVRHPERDTLERILAALGAWYTERRDVLEVFGYVVDAPIPDEDEIAWAINACQAELDSAVFPAYLLDCAHRLLTWNAIFPKLFGAQPPRLSMLKIVFDPAYGMTPLIANPEIFFPAQIRALRYEMNWFGHEPWYAALIDEMLQRPVFAQYWAAGESKPTQQIAARPLTSLEVNLPQIGRLEFRLIAEPFALDRRFRVIYNLPADPATMQHCLTWYQTRT